MFGKKNTNFYFTEVSSPEGVCPELLSVYYSGVKHVVGGPAADRKGSAVRS